MEAFTMADRAPFPLTSAIGGVVVQPRRPWSRADWATAQRAFARACPEHACPFQPELAPETKASTIPIALDEWSDRSHDLLAQDERVHRLEDAQETFCWKVRVTEPHALGEMACILDRYQRLLPLPAAYRPPPELGALLERHRSLHTLTKPLVRADYDHALDTWRWLLRLTPRADLALQCAALFHDVERLESEADRRQEHLAKDYVAFKLRHARRGAQLLAELLSSLLDADTLSEACRLVAEHELPRNEPRLQRLADADGLSFFSLNSYGYLRYFGPERTRAKLDYTLARMSTPARARARALHHHPLIAELLD